MFFTKYRMLLFDVIIALALIIALLHVQDTYKDFFIGLAFGVSLIRLGVSIAALKRTQKRVIE